MAYIEKLNSEQIQQLFESFGYKKFDESLLESYTFDDNTALICYDNCSITDFDVEHEDELGEITRKPEEITNYRKFMFSIFGDEYKSNLIEHLNAKKEKIFNDAIKSAEEKTKSIDEEIMSL